MTDPVSNPGASAPDAPPVPPEAYLRLLDEIKALTPDDLLPINVDIPTAATTALGALPAIRGMHERIAKELPLFPLARLDLIEDCAHASVYAHAVHLAAISSKDLTAVLAEADELRKTLASDAAALVRRKLLDSKQISNFHGGPGHRVLAVELLGLASVLRTAWPSIQGKTGTTQEELNQAAHLSARILAAVGERDQTDPIEEEAAQRRQQAFTLLARTYDLARKAAWYLRWEAGDADELVPSLYAGRIGSHSKAEGTTQPAVAKPAQPSEPAHPAAPTQETEPPLPGGNPFLKH